MDITIAIVAYNEKDYLKGLFDSILSQTYPKKNIEILLIDSMSEDNTKEIMEKFKKEYESDFLKIRVIQNEGRIQSSGWNEAIRAFSAEALIRVDAHSIIDKSFVEQNVRLLEAGENVCGGVRPTICAEDTRYNNTLHMAEESMFGSSISSSRRESDKEEKTYVKSLFHAAYKREVLEKVGGFREDLGRTEDNEFHYRIRKAGYKICLSNMIHSFQYIRPTFKKMLRQKYQNGYWIGLTLGVCKNCLSLYHFVPFVFVAGIIFTAILSMLAMIYNIFLLAAPALVMYGLYFILAILMSVKSSIDFKRELGKKGYPFLLPFMFLLLHISYGIGTLVGIIKMPFWRKTHYGRN